jgi:hypothetical protein
MRRENVTCGAGAVVCSGYLEMEVEQMVVMVVMLCCWLLREPLLRRVLEFSVPFGSEFSFGAIIGAALIPDEVVSEAVSSEGVWRVSE